MNNTTRERHAPNRLEVGTGKKTYSDVVQVVKTVEDVRRNQWGREGEKASNPALVSYKLIPSRFKLDHRGQTCKGTLDTSSHLST